MPRKPEQANTITASELEAFAIELERARLICLEAQVFAKESVGLATFSYKSHKHCLTFLTSFVRQLEYALYRAKSGQPLKDGDLKPRSTAKQPIDHRAAKKIIETKIKRSKRQ